MFGSAPAPPDYTGAAIVQGQAAQGLTKEQTYANRPDISTPWGSVSWTPPAEGPAPAPFAYSGPTAEQLAANMPGSSPGFDPNDIAQKLYQQMYQEQKNKYDAAQLAGGGDAPGRWGMRLNLSPAQQAAFEAQQRLTGERSGLAEEMFGRARGELGGAPDFSGLPEFPTADAATRGRVEDALYGRATSRLDPQFQQRQQELDIQLRNQGIMPGSEMYRREMDNLGRERERAYAGARQEAVAGGGAEESRQFGLGLTARQSAIAEMLQRRGWTLNEIQSLLSGQQIGMPQMPGFTQAGVSQPPQYLQAAGLQDQANLSRYGISQAQLQGLMSGAGGMATLPFMF